MRLSLAALVMLEERQEDIVSFHDPDSELGAHSLYGRGEIHSWVLEQDEQEILRDHLADPDQMPLYDNPNKETN
jgi:hypothetical protein